MDSSQGGAQEQLDEKTRQLFFAFKQKHDSSLDLSAFQETIAFMNDGAEHKLGRCRTVIENCILSNNQVRNSKDHLLPIAISESASTLTGYATLDTQHINEIKFLQNSIKEYLDDASRRKPLNILMLAAPGAGKSHFIKELSISMSSYNVKPAMFNMATMEAAADLAQPIDEARNAQIDGSRPLLFLDEFDTDPSRYALLLPLLWDGKLTVGSRGLKLGKVIIVLAGSNPDLPKTMEQAGTMKDHADSPAETRRSGKLVDLLSRINGGVISIPDLDHRSESRDRRIDKICIAVSLLKYRFGRNLKSVPRALLSFVGRTRFRYGVRSLEHLIESIRREAQNEAKDLNLASLGLPFINEEELGKHSLRFHLSHNDGAYGIVRAWQSHCQDTSSIGLRSALQEFLITPRYGL
jgi:hypothetical protein